MKTRINPKKDFKFVLKINNEVVGKPSPFYRNVLLPYRELVREQAKEKKKNKELVDYTPITFSVDKVNSKTLEVIENKQYKRL